MKLTLDSKDHNNYVEYYLMNKLPTKELIFGITEKKNLKETKFKMAAALQQQQLKNKQPKWQ
jgi:hypothetical protein